MKQEVDGQLLGAASFAAARGGFVADYPMVAFMAHGVSERGSCSMLLDAREIRDLIAEAEAAAIAAFGPYWRTTIQG